LWKVCEFYKDGLFLEPMICKSYMNSGDMVKFTKCPFCLEFVDVRHDGTILHHMYHIFKIIFNQP